MQDLQTFHKDQIVILGFMNHNVLCHNFTIIAQKQP